MSTPDISMWSWCPLLCIFFRYWLSVGARPSRPVAILLGLVSWWKILVWNKFFPLEPGFSWVHNSWPQHSCIQPKWACDQIWVYYSGAWVLGKDIVWQWLHTYFFSIREIFLSLEDKFVSTGRNLMFCVLLYWYWYVGSISVFGQLPTYPLP